ncbi:MAG: glycosyltransferase, partial [Alphaproteobacteria bacterium]|nr:glycosyltransferase [Alphaproteobacteria bacterium]
MPALLASCTLIAYPSHYGEGVPKSLLEALATGRAIVTTDHPGCREAVTHGENGLLVPVKNPETTADALQSLLNDPPRRQAMGKNGRRRAENEFTVEKVVEDTLRIYEDSKEQGR